MCQCAACARSWNFNACARRVRRNSARIVVSVHGTPRGLAGWRSAEARMRAASSAASRGRQACVTRHRARDAWYQFELDASGGGVPFGRRQQVERAGPARRRPGAGTDTSARQRGAKHAHPNLDAVARQRRSGARARTRRAQRTMLRGVVFSSGGK